MKTSIRQQRKAMRVSEGKKDKHGYSMGLSRKVRRASRRLAAGLEDFKKYPENSNGKHQKNKPGAMNYH